MSAIIVEDLVKNYGKGKNQVKAVQGISFEVPRGARFGFLGPNGAGKTTTIRCLLGLLQTSQGTITIDGEKIHPSKDVSFRNKIGYLPGELGLYKEMTAQSLLKYFATLYDIKIDWKYIKEIATRLQVEMSRKLGELSKGNKQKVGILMALMGKFEILILDEPTSGLDPLMQAEFYQIISERQRTANCTVFVSSHVLPEVEKFCDQVAIIKKGKIIEISNIQDLKGKSLKSFELEFETGQGLKEFKNYIEDSFPAISIRHVFDNQIVIIVPPQHSIEILRLISEKDWDGKLIKDFTIKHSNLESIFMEYYKNHEIEEEGEK